MGLVTAVIAVLLIPLTDSLAPISFTGDLILLAYLLALGRMGWDPATRTYVTRRTAAGLSKPEIMRCLKRYVARELFPLIQAITEPHDLQGGGGGAVEIAA